MTAAIAAAAPPFSFVTVWAQVELFLDLLLVILAKPELPHQLSVKLSTIRKKLNGSQLRNAKPIMALLDEIEALSTFI